MKMGRGHSGRIFIIQLRMIWKLGAIASAIKLFLFASLEGEDIVRQRD